MNPRIAKAEALLADFGWEVAHCRQVRDLAVALFDQLPALHRLGAAERDLLAAAALLHDIGWTVSHDKHHKHAFRRIREIQRRLAGFSGLDRPHRQEVHRVTGRVTDSAVTIRVLVRNHPVAYQAGGERKNDLFEQVFRLPLRVEASLYSESGKKAGAGGMTG